MDVAVGLVHQSEGGEQAARDDRQQGHAEGEQGDDGKEEDEQAAQSDHQSEGPEVDGDEGHELRLVADVAIAEVLEVVLERGQEGADGGLVGTVGLRPSIVGQGLDGHLAALYLLVGRGLAGAVRPGVATQQVVDARDVAVRVVGGHDRQGVGHVELQCRRRLVGIVGLTERVDPCQGGQALVGAAVVEGLHGGKLHRLGLGHLLAADVAGEGGSEGGDEAHEGADLNALLGQPRLALAEQIPGADGDAEDGADDP